MLIFKSGVLTETNTELEDAMQAAFFVTFYIINTMLLPGKIENWTIVNDLDNIAINKLPTKFIIKFLGEAQRHFKCRGRRFFLFNVTFAIRAIYKIISPFLDEKIKQKLVMTKDSQHQDLIDQMHPSQLEKKYGGEAENYTTFWPPQCSSDEFGCDPDLIHQSSSSESSHEISEEECSQSYSNSDYSNTKRKTQKLGV